MNERTMRLANEPFAANKDAPSAVVSLQIDRDALRGLVAEVLSAQPNVDWPSGRLALTEEEAATACGVGRHVLRDLRLEGQLSYRTLGRRIIYTRSDVLAALDSIASPAKGG
ncbi:helix-turn-helix domain-containing protein [Lacipirellula sp.]|uniref:helix-turn-helix domain-containing protein n=1 Tax=Lacipirellula sp. TaxID=2691419 RepID=UPI003D10AE3B